MTRVLSVAVAALVLGGVYALVAFIHPRAVGAQSRQPHSLAVTSAVLACASPGAAAGGGVAVMAGPGSAGAGRAVVSRLGEPASPLGTVTSPARLSLIPVKPVPTPRASHTHAPAAHRGSTPSPSPTPSPSASAAPAPAVSSAAGAQIQASGAMARGLEAEQLAGTLPTARCTAPGTDFWFVGPGQHAAGRIELFLMNPGDQAADVSVQMATDAGPYQGSPDSGIAVAPHSMVVQSLSGVLHGTRVIALHVHTSVGQVAAALEEISGRATVGSWLPPAQAPAAHVVVPGLPGTSGARQLFVTVPGTQDARLRLTAVTSRGSYVPTAGGALDIPGGSAVDITLTSLAGTPAALKLSSNVPVTASALVPLTARGTAGLVAPATWPVQQQGVIAVNRDGGGTVSQLVLSAPGRAVSVRVWRGASGGSGLSKVVQIAAGHTLVVPLGRVTGLARGAPFSVVLTPLPGSGPLYASRVMMGTRRGAALQSLLTVESSLVMVRLPVVRSAFIGAGR